MNDKNRQGAVTYSSGYTNDSRKYFKINSTYYKK